MSVMSYVKMSDETTSKTVASLFVVLLSYDKHCEVFHDFRFSAFATIFPPYFSF